MERDYNTVGHTHAGLYTLSPNRLGEIWRIRRSGSMVASQLPNTLGNVQKFRDPDPWVPAMPSPNASETRRSGSMGASPPSPDILANFWKIPIWVLASLLDDWRSGSKSYFLRWNKRDNQSGLYMVDFASGLSAIIWRDHIALFFFLEEGCSPHFFSWSFWLGGIEGHLLCRLSIQRHTSTKDINRSWDADWLDGRLIYIWKEFCRGL